MSSAYAKLVGVARSCREHALGLPSQKDLVTYWSGVGFKLSGQHYVVPLTEVSEILQVPRYTKVPGVESWMLGVANVRGRLLPVMDLVAFCKKEHAINESRRRLLVIDKDDLYSGLMVDEVMGMQYFPVTDYRKQAEEIDDGVAEYVAGEYRANDAGWTVFSFEALAEDPRFLQVARA